MSVSFIAVHGGAGFHTQKNEAAVKQALKQACSVALHKSELKPLDLVQTAIEVLEDGPNLNAGTGSNLTLDGGVECDAAIMDSSFGEFGSVGAVSGIKNPIRLARTILEYSKEIDPLGRIPPLTLVSEGARKFARDIYGKESDQLVAPESLMTSSTKKNWEKWKERLTQAKKAHAPVQEGGPTLYEVQDTVGAVAGKGWSETAAGVSSGGLLLKHPGRVGEASAFGAGCWAQSFADIKMSVACSVSGAGEYVTRSMLARAVGGAIAKCISEGEEVDPHEVLQEVLEKGFLAEGRKYRAFNLDAGILLLIIEENEGKIIARVWCAFTTPSMAIAYASVASPKPKVHILRHPPNAFDCSERKFFITAMTV